MSGSKLYGVLKRPIITEKANDQKEHLNQYSFEVDQGANKVEIRQAVTALFKVEVAEVKTAVVRGKNRRIGKFMGKRPNWKKAIVTLKEGHEIDFFGEA
jgi:large subunit ribosomal protein L23